MMAGQGRLLCRVPKQPSRAVATRPPGGHSDPGCTSEDPGHFLRLGNVVAWPAARLVIFSHLMHARARCGKGGNLRRASSSIARNTDARMRSFFLFSEAAFHGGQCVGL